MNQTLKTLIKPLKIWHIAPLLLPLLLGSASMRVASSPPSTGNVASPLLTSNLPKNLRSLFPQQPQLPSKTVKSLSQSPAVEQQKAASQTTKSQTNPQQASQPKSSSSASQASIARAESPQPARNQSPIPLRVAVAIDAQTLTVATSDPGIIMDQAGRALGQLTAQDAVAVSPSSTGLQVGSFQAPSMVWIKPSTAEGLVYVDGKWYRGPVQLMVQSDGLLAVNHTDLETYLYSVVGAEMPAYWPLEALKAQAIAARSYAVVHIARPASDFYDLGSTTRWQAYNGAETETNTTQLAVNETRGILLSYQGGVVESLYASSEEIVKEAHSGFGMSQEGANQLAQQNFNYQQILGRFYPGTSLAVLNIQ
jgi:stage II sporulation protein D